MENNKELMSVSLNFSEKEQELLREIANEENRSVGNLIETVVRKKFKLAIKTNHINENLLEVFVQNDERAFELLCTMDYDKDMDEFAIKSTAIDLLESKNRRVYKAMVCLGGKPCLYINSEYNEAENKPVAEAHRMDNLIELVEFYKNFKHSII